MSDERNFYLRYAKEENYSNHDLLYMFLGTIKSILKESENYTDSEKVQQIERYKNYLEEGLEYIKNK